MNDSEMGDKERPSTVNGSPVEWRENDHGVTKCYVQVSMGETTILTVPRHIRNPFTGRRHDLTKLSDDGYLKPFLALLSATNSPDHINVAAAPVLAFDRERFEYREVDGNHVLVKREGETKFGEMVVGDLHRDGSKETP